MELTLQLVASIATGLAATIPLVLQLVKYIKAAIKEKNWIKVLDLVMKHMAVAEEKYATGAERKEYVMGMIETSASTIDYDIDMQRVSKLIDDLCDLSKNINVAH